MERNKNEMSDFAATETDFHRYYQFPEFLIQLPISQTAKLTYMLLYDRFRLSKKNNRRKNGRVYVNYTIASMADILGKSQSTVKNAYKELDQLGLLIRKNGGYSKPNDLYILVPDSGKLSDLVKKPAAAEAENDTDNGQNPVSTTDRNLAPNKVIEQVEMSQNNNEKQFETYGKYKKTRPDFPDYTCKEGESF